MRTVSTEGVALTGAAGTFTVGVGGAASRVYGVKPIYDSGAPATTVMTVTNMGRTVFTSPASNTSQYYPVLEAAYGTNGTILSTGNPYIECVVSGTISVAISGAAASVGAGYGLLLFLYDD